MKLLARSLIPLCLVLASACSQKLPARYAAVPADADVVATLELQPLLAFNQELIAQAVPAELRDKIPTLEQLGQQALQLAGIDLAKITRVTLIGYVESKDRMAIIVEGIGAAGLKGSKSAERAGRAVYSLGGRMFYSELTDVGVAFAPSAEMLNHLIDAFAGQQKNLTDGDTGKMLRVLSRQEKELDQVRAYFVNGRLAAGNPQFSLKGAGVFIHLERGICGLVLSDEASVSRMKQGLDLAMMAFQTSLAFGGAKDSPLNLNPKATQRLGELLRQVSSRQEGERLLISFRGDLRPILREAAGYLVDAFRSSAAAPAAESEPSAPAAPKAPMP